MRGRILEARIALEQFVAREVNRIDRTHKALVPELIRFGGRVGAKAPFIVAAIGQLQHRAIGREPVGGILEHPDAALGSFSVHGPLTRGS
jgi:hypothetical protein